jgi:multiple sugar transport system substrate-binding protein
MSSGKSTGIRGAQALLAITAIVAIGGCAAASGDGGGGDGSLSIMGFSLTDEIATTRADLAAEAIAPTEPDIAEGEFDQQAFLSAVASGDAPDVVYLPRASLGSYASRGAIVPLDDCISNAGINPDDWIDSARDSATFDGQLYGIPEFDQVRLMIINNRVLDAAGVSVEDVDGHDWDALESAATAMSQSSGSGVDVLGYDPKLPEFLPLWAKANGADLLSDDGTTAQLDDPKVVEALEFAVGLIEAQGGWADVKAAKDASDFFGAGNQYAVDSLGAMPMENWYINVLADESPDVDITVTPFLDREGQPLSYATGNVWAIPRGADDPEAACAYVAAMTSVDTWVAAAQARADARAADGKVFTGLLTGNAVADQQIAETVYQASGNAQWDDAVQAVTAADEAAFTVPASAAPQEFEDAWRAAVDRVLSGQQTAEQALAQAQTEAQSALDAAQQG